ncbi:hypothetical protein KFE94_17855 [bacterium SCSIO 12643]|nr:hypothetical protein KFE94_17855 [bacterium SCSIO 12643]
MNQYLSKWRTIGMLIFLYIAILKDWQWIWGILFSIWVIENLKSQSTYLIEPIERKDTPVLYWSMVVTWTLLAIYSFSSIFI